MNQRKNKAWEVASVGSIAMIVMLSCVGVTALSGCKEKVKVVKAPPPPPPPPPKEVAFDDLFQEMKSDARVSAAQGLGITDESFARAAAKFADALARGDDAGVAKMLNRQSQGVLEVLKSSGGWGETTKGIEAVRIIFAQAPQTLTGIERDHAFETMGAAIAAAAERRYNQLVAQGFQRSDARAMANDEMARDIRKSVEMRHEVAAGLESQSMVLLLALQDSQGAYLLGWTGSQSGDSWTFSSASTTDLIRPKAKDWDGTGMVGFSLGTGRPPIAETAVASTPTAEKPPARRDGPEPLQPKVPDGKGPDTPKPPVKIPQVPKIPGSGGGA